MLRAGISVQVWFFLDCSPVLELYRSTGSMEFDWETDYISRCVLELVQCSSLQENLPLIKLLCNIAVNSKLLSVPWQECFLNCQCSWEILWRILQVDTEVSEAAVVFGSRTQIQNAPNLLGWTVFICLFIFLNLGERLIINLHSCCFLSFCVFLKPPRQNPKASAPKPRSAWQCRLQKSWV